MILVVFLSAVATYALLSFAPGGPLAGLRQITGNSRFRITEEDIAATRITAPRWASGRTPSGSCPPTRARRDEHRRGVGQGLRAGGRPPVPAETVIVVEKKDSLKAYEALTNLVG